MECFMFWSKKCSCYFSTFYGFAIKQYDFCLVYNDNILVASGNIKDHIIHLEKIFKTIEEAGIVISKKKTKIEKTYINFLGLKIGNSTIELQLYSN